MAIHASWKVRPLPSAMKYGGRISGAKNSSTSRERALGRKRETAPGSRGPGRRCTQNRIHAIGRPSSSASSAPPPAT